MYVDDTSSFLSCVLHQDKSQQAPKLSVKSKDFRKQKRRWGVGKKPKSSSKPKEGSIELRNKTQTAPNRKMKCEGKGDKSALHFKVLKGKNANNKDKSRTKRQTHPQLNPKQTPSKSFHAGPLCVRMGRLVSYLGLSGRLLLSCRRLCPLVGQCSQHQHPYEGKDQDEIPSKPQ